MIMLPFYPLYVKKEDIKGYIEQKKKIIEFSLGFFTVFVGVTGFTFYFLFQSDYLKLNLQPPLLLQMLLYITLVGTISSLVLTIYVIMSKPNYDLLLKKLDKYKDQDMINAREIPLKYDSYVWVVFIFVVAILLITTALGIK